MSGLPTKEKVSSLRVCIAEYRRLTRAAAKIREQIGQLTKLEEDAGRMKTEILKALEDMNVKAPESMGWEGRMVWFLTELDSQSRLSMVTKIEETEET